MTQWLFVGGMGRTGTALLAWCLGLHPDIEMGAQESLLPLKLRRLFEPLPGLLPGALEWRCGEAVHEQTEHLFTYGRNVGGEPEGVVRDPGDVARACLRGLQEHLAPDKAYLGDRSAAYSVLWPQVRELCPGSEIVYIDREPGATASSWVRMGFAGTEEEARVEIEQRTATAQQCTGARWLTLEELEQWPQDVLSKLLMDLGLDPLALPWEQVVAQIHGPQRLD